MPTPNHQTFDLLMLPLGAAQLGGAERSIAELAIQLKQRGRSIAMLVDRAMEATPYGQWLREAGIHVEWVDWHPDKGYWENWRCAWRVFKKFRAPLIQFNISWRSKMWLVPLAAKLVNSNVRMIGTIRSMPDSHHNLPKKYYLGYIPSLRLWLLPAKFIGWTWSKLLTYCVSINADDFPARLSADYFFPPQNIRIIKNGIPARNIPYTVEQRTKLRQEIGLEDSELFLLYAGRLASDKGIDDLLKALKLLPDAIKLNVIGTGPEQKKLEELTTLLDLSKRVNFHGFHPNPRDWMAAADIVITPSSEPEAFGRTVIEAMAESTAIIATRAGGMGEIFIDQQEGLYVPMRNPEELAKAIQALVENPSLRSMLAHKGYQRYCSQYSVARVCDQYMQLYQEHLVEASLL